MFFKMANILAALLFAAAFDPRDNEPHENIVRKPEPYDIVKKSMLVGMSETTEEVCETIIFNKYEPAYGHLLNGSQVEVLQRGGYKFVKTHVQCLKENRPPCHGVKDNMYISECVTVYENADAMVRLINSFGPFRMGTIRVPILCECRLRRQYRHFERVGLYDDDDRK
uniref:NGF domain-containing protein n=2 Tax=Caenorhabditis tropicalis TaxID=1561998 RepID=A0A1I7TZR4_9PELO